MAIMVRYEFSSYPISNNNGTRKYTSGEAWVEASSDPLHCDSFRWMLRGLRMTGQKPDPVQTAKVEAWLRDGGHNREIENALIREAYGK